MNGLSCVFDCVGLAPHVKGYCTSRAETILASDKGAKLASDHLVLLISPNKLIRNRYACERWLMATPGGFGRVLDVVTEVDQEDLLLLLLLFLPGCLTLLHAFGDKPG